MAYEGELEGILSEATRPGVVNLTSRDADLEEIFLAYYPMTTRTRRAMARTSVETRAIGDRTRAAVYFGLGLGATSAPMGAIASRLQSHMADLFSGLPEAFAGLIGGAGSNYVVTELFGLIAPIVVLLVAIAGGSSVYAEEEQDRGAVLLLTEPVTRRHVVLAKSAVLIGNLLLVCVLFLAGTALASAVVSVDGFEPANAFAATTHLFFLALAFAMIALLVGVDIMSSLSPRGVFYPAGCRSPSSWPFEAVKDSGSTVCIPWRPALIPSQVRRRPQPSPVREVRANGAWLAIQVFAHNLARWTERLGLRAGIRTTKTLRRRLFALPGRLARSARRLTLHLPARWPWADDHATALLRLRALPSSG